MDMHLIYLLLLAVSLQQLLLCVHSAEVIEIQPCENRVNQVDRAKLFFHFPSTPTNLTIYALNDDCYKCSWSFVANQTTSSSCVVIWTPHAWTLYLADTTELLANSNTDSYYYPNNLLAVDSFKKTFVEEAVYTITVSADDNNMAMEQNMDGLDSLLPLYLMIAVLGFIAFVAFSYEPFLAACQSCFGGGGNDLSVLIVRKDQQSEAQSPLIVSSSNAETTPTQPQAQPAQPKRKKAARLRSLDTFRGLSLMCMIFVNYGGGGYWFFDHAAWNGLTFADLLFPWFMWIMGVSMALSFSNILPEKPSLAVFDDHAQFDIANKEYYKQYRSVWYKATIRAIKLFLIGMFLANGWEYTTWRVPGVLQYFAVSYFVVSATILLFYPYTQDQLQAIKANAESRNPTPAMMMKTVAGDEEGLLIATPQPIRAQHVEETSNFNIWGMDRVKNYFNVSQWTMIFWAYRYEWVFQAMIAGLYLGVVFGVAAPGCKQGYVGAGGISEHSEHMFCTGGIHRYLDMKAFGYWFIYHHPTCKELYHCHAYDPEGLLGSLMACTLTYLGLMTGRIFLHYKQHMDRLLTMWIWAAFLLLLAGILCGFSKNEGLIPINKNLWSTSFVLVTSGFGLVGLSWCYIPIDIYKVWTGAPMIYLGMNSIIIYVGHSLLANYMPFSYKLYHFNHKTMLLCTSAGVLSWVLIAFYFYRIKFFVKV